MFTLETEPLKKMVVAKLSGFWSTAVAARFATEERAAVSRLPCRPGEHVLLCDMREMGVSSQDVVELLSQELNKTGAGDARRIAIVWQSPLSRMQVSRVTTRDDVRLFDNRNAAEAWLTEPV